jgi:guanylate kinase
MFDIDWQGTRQLAEKMPKDIVSIFILPPSWHELERRLFSRADETPAEINRRMSRATEEMSHWNEYHYIIVNHDLDESVATVREILHAERLKRRRQIGLHQFVSDMLDGH